MGEPLSHSRIATLKACRRRYFNQYVLGLQPRQDPQPLRMGQAFTQALERWNLDPIEPSYKPWLDMAKNQSEIAGLNHEMFIVETMASGYMKLYVQPMRREVAFKFPLDVEGFAIRGSMDGWNPTEVQEDKLRKPPWKDVAEALSLDDQITGMLWAERRLRAEEMGVEPATLPVLPMDYRITVKPQLRRNWQKESETAFRRRIVADVADRQDYYYRRYRETRTPQQLDEHWDELNYFARAIQYEEQQGVWPKNPQACEAFGGCPFIKLCNGKEQADSGNFIVIEGRRNMKHHA